ncbi:hypothetical protein HLB02_17565 [Serratia nevei]|nr:hypothetical protein [Serratia nevei]
MAEPYIRVNQFFANSSGEGQKTPLGHVNFTFIDGNGINKGTFGANMKTADGKPSGIHEEESDNQRRIQILSPHDFKRVNISKHDFDQALAFASQANRETLNGNLSYALACGNCVDFGMQIFNKTALGRAQLPNYLKPHTALSIYAHASNLLCSGDSYQRKEVVRVAITGDKWRPQQLPEWAQPCIDAKVKQTMGVAYEKGWGESNDAWDVIKAVTLSLGTCEKPVKQIVVQYMGLISPLVIDLDGRGIKTTSIFDHSVEFDLLGVGFPVTSAWIEPNSGFLVLSKNRDETVTDINDLFGGKGRMDGFYKLAEFDTLKRGFIDKDNEIYADLRVWVDKNKDGVVDKGEIFTLAELNIEKLYLNFDIVDITDVNGNLLGERSKALIDGVEHELSEVYFKYA